MLPQLQDQGRMNLPMADGDGIVRISSFKKLGEVSKIHRSLNSGELHSSAHEKKEYSVKHFAKLFAVLLYCHSLSNLLQETNSRGKK